MKNILMRYLVVFYVFIGSYAFAECNEAISINEQVKCNSEEAGTKEENDTSRKSLHFGDEVADGVIVEWCLDDVTFDFVECPD